MDSSYSYYDLLYHSLLVLGFIISFTRFVACLRFMIVFLFDCDKIIFIIM